MSLMWCTLTRVSFDVGVASKRESHTNNTRASTACVAVVKALRVEVAVVVVAPICAHVILLWWDRDFRDAQISLRILTSQLYRQDMSSCAFFLHYIEYTYIRVSSNEHVLTNVYTCMCLCIYMYYMNICVCVYMYIHLGRSNTTTQGTQTPPQQRVSTQGRRTPPTGGVLRCVPRGFSRVR